jgi:hypothetical protein
MTQTAQPLLGLAATISIGTQAASPVYTVINFVKKITPPKPKWGTEDTTTLGTPSQTRTFMKTLIDPGELQIEGLYEQDPGQVALAAAFNSAAVTTYGQAFPFKFELAPDVVGGQTTTGDTYVYSGLVTDYTVGEADIDKVVPFSATIKISGPPTFTEGS